MEMPSSVQRSQRSSTSLRSEVRPQSRGADAPLLAAQERGGRQSCDARSARRAYARGWSQAASASFLLYELGRTVTWTIENEKKINGAEEGTRTPTPLRVHGPEPCASANSATSASNYGAAWQGRRREEQQHHILPALPALSNRSNRYDRYAASRGKPCSQSPYSVHRR